MGDEGSVPICSLSQGKLFAAAVTLVLASRWQPKIEWQVCPGFWSPPSLGKGVVLN